MGDRSFFGVTVYACPPDQVAPLLGVLRSVLDDADHEALPGDDTLDLGEQYADTEMALSTGGEVTDELVKVAPGATFVVVQGERYEYLGEWFRYAPDLGLHVGQGEDGDMYSGDAIMAAFDGAREEGKTPRDALLHLTGEAWTRRFAELRERDTVTVHAYPLCTTCGEDRVRTNPDAINPAAWPLYHVTSGREACDDSVVLRLARDDHPYQGMPAEYVGPVDADEDEAEQGPAVVVTVVLPNGRTIHVGLDEVTWPRVATAPEQTGAEQ